MSVRRTPACTGYFLGKIRINASHLISIDHLYIQSYLDRALCQSSQDLLMFLRLSKTKVSILMVLTIYFQFLRKCRPEIFDAIHHKRKLSRITSGLSDAAAVSARTAVSKVVGPFQTDHTHTTFCKIITDGAANNSTADNYYFCRFIHALHPPLPRLQISAFLSDASGLSKSQVRVPPVIRQVLLPQCL